VSRLEAGPSRDAGGARTPGAPLAHPPAGARTFRCARCGYALARHQDDPAPVCPSCGSTEFERASLFLDADTRDFPVPGRGGSVLGLEQARARVPSPGPYLALAEGDEIRLVPLAPESLVRLGRSLQADIRLDDVTVSRRHAVVHRRGRSVAITDDHSLNGVFVNGQHVEWAELADGDEIQLGVYRLLFLDAREPERGGGAPSAPAS
jgi:predicted  nucleic acid-binding Zn-ribbon protein